MFISYISILLLFLFIHHGEFAITATAVLYRNESNVTGGTLTIVQNNGDTPVSITGTLSGFNDSTVHVCLIKKINKRIYRLFFYSRVFMSIHILYLNLFQIVQQLVNILILIVIHRILNSTIKFFFFFF
jgi:hypothetical protein